MQGHMHAQALLIGHRVLFRQTAVGVPGLPARRLTALRMIPRQIFTFRFDGVLTMMTLRALPSWFSQGGGRPSHFIILPEADLFPGY